MHQASVLKEERCLRNTQGQGHLELHHQFFGFKLCTRGSSLEICWILDFRSSLGDILGLQFEDLQRLIGGKLDDGCRFKPNLSSKNPN